MKNSLLAFAVIFAGSSFACGVPTLPQTDSDRSAASRSSTQETAPSNTAQEEASEVDDAEPTPSKTSTGNDDDAIDGDGDAGKGGEGQAKLQACLDGCSQSACFQQCVEDFAATNPEPGPTRAGDELGCCVNKQFTVCTATSDGQVCGTNSSPGANCRHDKAMDALCQ